MKSARKLGDLTLKALVTDTLTRKCLLDLVHFLTPVVHLPRVQKS